AGSGADIAWMQGSGVFTFAGAGFPTIGSVDGLGTPTWAGVGDYTHDGKDDLFWYYAGDGTLHTCDATGTTFANCTMRRGPGVGKPDWAGVGDFDGDGYRDDIAWLQGSALFTFSGTGLATIGSVDGLGTPTWAGVGDYTHDGKDDLFWFYPDGTLHTCESTGTTFTNCTMRRGPGIGTPDWAGVGDFDGDGYRDDIAWLQGSAVFTFSGTALATIGSVDGLGTPTWAGVGDYNRDGKDDLIWYYGADGTLHTCESTGTTFTNCGLRRGPGIGTPTWAATGTFH
ncbi:VCBS repeat-containing protein, partial [Asanoa sp. NPDC049573]|uniref:FG-GAP repeat domain-containing protein n=1 Tax=Asanoa sp. NPDC049573 TaxID=3155396 RepID=UPI003418C9CC